MPLVTLTCSKPYYPSEASQPPYRGREQITATLASDLPRLIIECSDALGLEPGTPAEAVQVDIKQFHPLSVNAVDVWVHVQLSENYSRATKARDALISILEDYFKENRSEPNWALDMFWGPGHGKYSFRSGETMTW